MKIRLVKTCDFFPVFGPQDCLEGIVISVKILGLKFLPYIAEICNLALRTGMDDITGFLSL
jgi:hypothetical protein